METFFDTVPQDRLMSFVGRIIQDPESESLIRKYLKAGVMDGMHYESTEIGTPRGGNLSPLLSNVMLHELDKELERRGLRYVRYADDCVIFVGSEASAKRVMRSVSGWIERKLGLKVNAEKSHIGRPSCLKYLGFGFYKNPVAKCWSSRPHDKSVEKFQRKLKRLCKRNWGISMSERISRLNPVIRGWINYFSLSDMKTKMRKIERTSAYYASSRDMEAMEDTEETCVGVT